MFGSFLVKGARVGRRELGRRTGIPFLRVAKILTGTEEPKITEVALLDAAIGADGAMLVTWLSLAIARVGTDIDDVIQALSGM